MPKLFFLFPFSLQHYSCTNLEPKIEGFFCGEILKVKVMVKYISIQQFPSNNYLVKVFFFNMPFK